MSDFGGTISQDTLKNLHKQCKDFNYEIDSIIDLSSDVSEGMPKESLDLKSWTVFEEAERQRRER